VTASTAHKGCHLSRTAALIVMALGTLSACNIPAVGDDTGKSPRFSGAQMSVRHGAIHPQPLRIDVNRVVLNVTVTGPDDRTITGLAQSAFEIYDDKVPQRIASFSCEDAPVSVAIIFDSSGSMADKMDQSKDAILEFAKTANPQDEFMLVEFNDRPESSGGFCAYSEDFETRLLAAQAGGRTALVDALYLGLHQMRNASNSRKALLVISDGGENHSRYTTAELRRAIQESDAAIYTVGVFARPATRHRTQEEAAGPGFLDEFSNISGGRMFVADSLADLPGIMQKISRAMRDEYVISYQPSNLVRDGRWRRLRVKVQPPKSLRRLHIYARAGYYAPTQ